MRTRLTQDDLDLRQRRLLTNVPSAETLAKGRTFFREQAVECRTLALKYPEMLAAAERFEARSRMVDSELANCWPLARAEALRRTAVRDEMLSTQKEHGRCPECR